jgi:hypothetical protein
LFVKVNGFAKADFLLFRLSVPDPASGTGQALESGGIALSRTPA